VRELTVAPPPALVPSQTPSPPSPPSTPSLLPEPPTITLDLPPACPIEGPLHEPPITDEPTADQPIDDRPIPLKRSTCTEKPTLHILDLILGEGITAVTDADEAGGVSPDTLHAFTISEEFGTLEHTSCAEALELVEPRPLAEAKRFPDWPLWEAAIHQQLATPELADTRRLKHAPSGSSVTGSKEVSKFKIDIKQSYLTGVSTPGEVLSMQLTPGFQPPYPGGHVLQLHRSCREAALTSRQEFNDYVDSSLSGFW
jgi:hypothetical protein